MYSPTIRTFFRKKFAKNLQLFYFLLYLCDIKIISFFTKQTLSLYNYEKQSNNLELALWRSLFW